MNAPPGVKTKKFQIISNAPSVPGATDYPKKANLSNSDFRSLLEKSKTRQKSEEDDAETRKKNDKDIRAAKRLKKVKSFERWQARKAQLQQEAQHQYRDRAAERRLDENPDYKDTEEFQQVDIEKSKFLGGDVEHTHLVKGLDYALLQKTKAAMEREEEERLEKEFEENEARKNEAKKLKEEATKVDEPRFITHMGRAVYDCCITKAAAAPIKEKVTQFLPGRMTFEFELDEFGSALPTTLLQPKSDLPTTDERLSGLVNADIRKRIAKIMEYLGQGSHKDKKGLKDKNKKQRKDLLTEGEEGHQNADEEDMSPGDAAVEKRVVATSTSPEDDIFAGAGSEYVPADSVDVPVKQERDDDEEGSSNRRSKKKYFDGDHERRKRASSPAKSDSDEDDGGGEDELKVAKEAAARERIQTEIARFEAEKKEKNRKDQDPNYVDEVYTECYPATYAGRGTFVVDDESDDEDLTRMDQGGRSKKPPVRPWDFDNEGDWGKFNDQKEAVPKAAFQFGLKMKDGRKNKTEKLNNPEKTVKQQAASKEQKFEKQYQQLQQMMQKRAMGEKHKKGPDLEDERSMKRNRILLKTPAHD